MLSVWEERKVRLYANIHQSHSQNDSGGVAGGDGELGCLCGKAGTVMAPPIHLGAWSMLWLIIIMTMKLCHRGMPTKIQVCKQQQTASGIKVA